MGDFSITQIAVVIPARDEETSIANAVMAARVAASALPADVHAEIVVVANGCTDSTRAVAVRSGAHVVTSPTPNVGSARALGHAWALRRSDDVSSLWIASTDADSMVPGHWLTAQMRAAEGGADVFLGTIALDPVEAQRHARWTRQYRTRGATQDHRHIHGANLGVRATSYQRAGGFRSLSLHEDLDLVTRLLETGAVPAWVDSVPVMTSARHDARIVGGVASDLAASGPH